MRFHLPRMVITRGLHSYDQAELGRLLHARVGGVPDIETLYARTQVRRRQLEVSETGWHPSGCTERINEAVRALGKRAIEALFAGGASGFEPSPSSCPEAEALPGEPPQRNPSTALRPRSLQACNGLVVVCTSSSGYPGLGRHLQAACGFADDTLVFDLDGAGCGGAPQGLHLAHALLARGDCSEVCLVVVDALGSYSQSRDHVSTPTVAQVTAHSMASDGAVACLLRTGMGPGLSWSDCRMQSRFWADGMHLNAITAEGQGNPRVWVDRDPLERVQQKFDWLLEGLPRPTPPVAAGTPPVAPSLSPAHQTFPDTLAVDVVLQAGGAALLELARRHSPHLAPILGVAHDELTAEGHVGAPFLLCCLGRALHDPRFGWGPKLRLATTGPGPLASWVGFDDVEFRGFTEPGASWRSGLGLVAGEGYACPAPL